MTINRNDPRWTAYVLNELDAAERAAFEREMAADPEAESILDEIRETVLLLEHSLAAAPQVDLSAAQKQEIHEAVGPAALSSRFRWVMASGIAAVLLAGFVSLMIIPDLAQSPDSNELAQLEPVPSPGSRALERAAEPARGVSRELSEDAFGFDDALGNERDRLRAEAEVVPAGEAAPSEQRAQTATEFSNDPNATAVTSLASRADLDSAGQAARTTDVEVEIDAQALLTQSSATVGDVVPEYFERNLPLVGNNLLDRVEALPSDQKGAGEAVPGVVGGVERGVIGGVLGGVLNSRAAFVAGASPPPPPPPAAAPEEGLADARVRARFNTEEYDRIVDNPFVAVSEDPLATFSADVDTASYANIRRFLNQRTLPPRDAVRIEEMVNYFTYDYVPPTDDRPVRVHAEVATAPWAPEHRLVRIGIQGQQIDLGERSPTNLVFLIDVSGSMSDPNKLPLLKDGMKLLVEQLDEDDRVAIVVYAGASGLVLPSTTGDRTQTILRALDRLSAGGSTNGGAGIQRAYDTAIENFVEGGVNRVILATDGDFNVGVTDNGNLTRLIEEKAESGVFLSVLGFGTGNYNDAGLEALADRGNGNYAYIDGIREARKVLVEEMGSTLVTIAKDVKFQVEFNPAEVSAYRLIGYENRVLQDRDFNDDTKDAGEIGAGHSVTALFEVVPAGVEIDIPGVDPLRYQTALQPTDRAASGELLTVSIRYKEPDGDESRLLEVPVRDSEQDLDAATEDYRFQSAVAGFGMILRDSPYKGAATFDSVLDIAEENIGLDQEGYREEFIGLVRRARAIRDLGQ